MKFDNAVEIVLDEVVLLGNKAKFKIRGYDNQINQDFNWCYFKDKPEDIFCLSERIIKEQSSRTNLDNEIFEKKNVIINLKETIYNKLKKILNDNIDKFIEKNINNLAYLFETDKSDYETISLYEMGKDIRENKYYGLDVNIRIILNNFKYKDISMGEIQLSTRTGNVNFIFDMRKMEFEDEEIKIFKAIYGLSSLKKILAYEQYKRGLTPPFYNEIAKINKFLEGKKTVTLLLNDGESKQVPAQISNILATDYKEFWINTQMKNMDISNLRAIGYGKKELIINIENLINIDKQLDRIIEASEEKKLEIEDLENEC